MVSKENYSCGLNSFSLVEFIVPKLDYLFQILCSCLVIQDNVIGPSMFIIFRLDALALSVIATGTWLGGWLTHSGIVSKRLNLSENFFDLLKAPSL